MRQFSKLGLFGLIASSLVLGTGCGHKKLNTNWEAKEEIWQERDVKRVAEIAAANADYEALQDRTSEQHATDVSEIMGLTTELKTLKAENQRLQTDIVVPGKWFGSIMECGSKLEAGADRTILVWTLEGDKRSCTIPLR